MKYTLARILTSLSLTVLLFAGAARAQHAEKVIKVEVPFEFNVGDVTFPAGKYSLVQGGPFLTVRDSRGYILTTVLTRTVQAATPFTSTKLRFSTDGNRHVLTQVWSRDEIFGQQLDGRLPATAVAKHRAAPAQPAGGSQP
jgi:hypothetical protein